MTELQRKLRPTLTKFTTNNSPNSNNSTATTLSHSSRTAVVATPARLEPGAKRAVRVVNLRGMAMIAVTMTAG